MADRHVWSLPDADLKVFRETALGAYQDLDGGGNPVPVLTYCYAEGLQMFAGTALVRRAVSGRGRRKITTPAGVIDEISLSIDHLFWRKSEEYNVSQIFNPAQQLRIEVQFTDITYSNVAPFENDTFGLSFAKAKSFRITGSNDETIQGTVEFEAEKLL